MASKAPYWTDDDAKIHCAARRGKTDPPQDCDWPFCGCDPHADRVIAHLQECDLLCERATSAPDPQKPMPLAIPTGVLESPEERIERVVDHLDTKAVLLTNGEKLFMFTILISGILEEADPDTRAALLKEIISALAGRPSKLRLLCRVPCDGGDSHCGTCENCIAEKANAAEGC